MEKWKKQEVEIIEDVYKDFDNLLIKKGFHKESNFYSKFVYNEVKLEKGFKYEVHGSINHLTIFKFDIGALNKYELLETLLFKGFIQSRKQLIKTLNYYF